MKQFALKYHADFWEDLKKVIDWYDTVAPNITDQYLLQFYAIEKRISNNPYAFLRVSNTSFRRALLKQFPFKIFFKIEDSTVYIIALVHTKRSNKFIKKHLKNR